MQKCGQAALEYLLTYGLAFIIALFVLGILLGFMPRAIERCDARMPFRCEPAYMYVNATTGNLTIRFRNEGTVEYQIFETACGENKYVYPGGKRIWPGDSANIYFNCSRRTKIDAVPGRDFFEDEVRMVASPIHGIANETILIRLLKYYS